MDQSHATRLRYAALGSGLLAMTAMLYAPTVFYPYVFEDLNFPAKFLRPWRGFAIEASGLSTRVLTTWSFLGTHALWPSAPQIADHLASLSLHLLNVGLVLAVVAPFFSFPAALMAATVFAWHPLQTEAVAYISSRSELLIGTGVLLACCGVTYQRRWLIIGGALVAALSKEAGLMALPLAGLWWLQLRQQSRLGERSWRWTVPSVCVSLTLLLALIVWIWQEGQQFGWPLAGAQEILQHLTMGLWLASRFLWPTDLSIEHGWAGLTLTVTILSAILGLIIGACLWSAWTRWSRFAYCWLLVALIPRFLVHTTEPLHERHLYAATLGACFAVGITADRWLWPLKGRC